MSIQIKTDSEPPLRLLKNAAKISLNIEKLLEIDSILRPKQREAFKSLVKAISVSNTYRLAIVMPTGTGKMIMVARMIAAMLQHPKGVRPEVRILFVTDGIEGLMQTKDKIKAFAGVEIGLYYTNQKDLTHQVTATTYASWQDEYFPINARDIDLVILDEGHMGISEKRIATLNKYENAVTITLTASPDYSEERTIMDFFELGYKIDIKPAIDANMISGFRNILLNSNIDINLDDLSADCNGDYNLSLLSKALNSEARNRIGCEYLLFSNHPDTGVPIRHLQGIVSCVDVTHAKAMADLANREFEKYYPVEIPKHGFARCVSANSPDRRNVLRWHREGKIKYLTFANLLNQNYDDKKISVCLNLRLSYSKVLTTQRAGRAERLDESNPGKIALIVDLLDSYQGKVVKWPLLYSKAVGLVSHFSEDTAAIAEKQYAEFLARGFYYHMGPISSELREYVQQFEMRIITEEETIINLVNSRVPANREKDLSDLSVGDISIMTSLSKRMIHETFSKIDADWLWYNRTPALGMPPKIKLETVTYKGRFIKVLKKSEYNTYLREYLRDFNIVLERRSDMTAEKMHLSTGIPIEEIHDGFLNLKQQWNDFYNDPVTNPKPNIHIYKVGSKADGGVIVDCINVSKVDIFCHSLLARTPVRNRLKDDLTVQDLAKRTGCKEGRIRWVLRRIRIEWETYSHNLHVKERPAIRLGLINKNGAIVPVISENDFEVFVTQYLSKPIVKENISDYLTRDHINETTGISFATLRRGFKLIKDEWNAYRNAPDTFEKPAIDLMYQKNDRYISECIHKDHLKKFLQKMCGKTGFYKLADSDLTVTDLADRTGVATGTLQNVLKDIRDQWDAYEEGVAGMSKPDIYVKYARNSRNAVVLAIDKADLTRILERFRATTYVRPKSEDDLDTREIAMATGLSTTIIRKELKRLARDWNTFNAAPDSTTMPNCPIAEVRRNGIVTYTVSKEHLPFFKKSYLSFYYGKTKIADHMLSYLDLSHRFNIHKHTVRKYFKELKADWDKHFQNPKKYAKPCAPIYTVYASNNNPMLAIDEKDVETVLKDYFPINEISEKNDEDLNYNEIASVTGLRADSLRMGMKALEKDWILHFANPSKVPKPLISYKVVRRKGVKSMTISRNDIGIFLKSYCGSFRKVPIPFE